MRTKTILLRLSGGLGNQLFQYALGRHLSILSEAELIFDTHALSDDIRTYALGPFSIHGRISDSLKKDMRGLGLPNTENMTIIGKIIRKSFRLFESHKKLCERKFITESHFQFDPTMLEIRHSCYLSGFWQSEKYFKTIEDILRKDLVLKESLSSASESLAARMRSAHSISLHVRRGDYLANKTQGPCSRDYYERAVARIAERVPNPEFFIFSDDIAWAKDALSIGFPVTFVSGAGIPDYEEMVLMSTCAHHIIANSSFSWWGAWLNQNPNKIVIAPKQWFRAGNERTINLIPEGWIRT